jgi:hypothetical protein
MLHASFDIWYACFRNLRDMELQQKMSAEKRKQFEGFCEECDKYQSQRVRDDVNEVHQNGDAVFTRAHYEVLGTFLHAVVVNYLPMLRRNCPEWAFVVSEFHNFVIEREMQRLRPGWGGRGVGEVQDLIMRMQDLG